MLEKHDLNVEPESYMNIITGPSRSTLSLPCALCATCEKRLNIP